jgi:RNA recognition motif-containing protein
MANIFFANLSFTATEEDVRKAFEAFGNVSGIAIIKDKLTGKTKGFGFVEMPDPAQAARAIAGLHGKDLLGRKLQVNETRPRPEGREGPQDPGQQKPALRNDRLYRRRKNYEGEKPAVPFHKRTDRSGDANPRTDRKSFADRKPFNKNVKSPAGSYRTNKAVVKKEEVLKKQPFWAAVAKKSRPRNRKVAAQVRQRKESRQKES